MNVMRCPVCQKYNEVQFEFCRSCGANLWPQVQPEFGRRVHACEIGAPVPPATLRRRATQILRRFFGADHEVNGTV